jgi:PAS domain S-box-containing protein
METAKTKRAEDPLGPSESIASALIESATRAVLTVAADETIAFANGMAEKMFGDNRAELIGKPIAILIRRTPGSVIVSTTKTTFCTRKTGHI